MLKPMGKKTFTILRSKVFFLSKPVPSPVSTLSEEGFSFELANNLFIVSGFLRSGLSLGKAHSHWACYTRLDMLWSVPVLVSRWRLRFSSFLCFRRFHVFEYRWFIDYAHSL